MKTKMIDRSISEKVYDLKRVVNDPTGIINEIENAWERTPFVLSLTDEQQDWCKQIGAREELQNVPSEIPAVGIIGNYMYRMDPDDERFLEVIYDNPSGKDYQRLEYETDKNSFIDLLSGLSFLINTLNTH